MINTKDEFKKLVEDIQASDLYREPLAFGICRVDRGQLNSDKILQASFPILNWKENFGSFAVFLKSCKNIDLSKNEIVIDIDNYFIDSAVSMFKPYFEEAKGTAHKNVQVVKSLLKNKDSNNFKFVVIFKDENPESVEAVYLKLYALSLGKTPLRSVNLNGAFGLLSNVAWSGNQPIELDYLRENEVELKMDNKYPEINCVDKFPRFLQHIIPADNTRILETSKVRFGAQLAGGTTVMPGASYINFNAGTTGSVMVEGRISSSAIVGAGSDVGGGASILGVLSGTNGNPISIGKNSLLGANSVCGIPIGDGCIIDAGLAILEGTKISIEKSQLEKIKIVNPKFNCDNEVVKGFDLAGLNGIHFRQNSQTGKIIAIRSEREIKLNNSLH